MIKFQYTGNPFVDTGLAVMVAISDKETLSEINENDFKAIFHNAMWLGSANRKLKSTSLIIPNNPLIQSGYTKEKTITSAIKEKQTLLKKREDLNEKLNNIKSDKLDLIKNEVFLVTQELDGASYQKEKDKLKRKLCKKEESLDKEILRIEKQKNKIKDQIIEIDSVLSICENRITNNSDRGLIQYSAILEALANDFLSNNKQEYPLCEVTGLYPATQIFNSLSDIISKKFPLNSSELKKTHDYQIGRDWFPLAGSLGNDAQALPAGSRSPHISALAILAAQLLPMGVISVKRFVKGEAKSFLVCLQFNIPEVNELIVKRIYEDVHSKVQLASERNKVKTIGTGKGSKSLSLFLIEQLKELSIHKEYHNIEHLHLNVWLFSNFGTGADCDYFEVPNASLKFLIQASETFHEELHEMLLQESNKTISLLEAIERHEDYMPLYPYKNSKKVAKTLLAKASKILENYDEDEHDELTEATLENTKIAKRKTLVEQLQAKLKNFKKDNTLKSEIQILISEIEKSQSRPASKELFKLYQTQIVGRNVNALIVAERIALYLKTTMITDKEQTIIEKWINNDRDKRFRKEIQFRVKEKIIEMAFAGKMTLYDYINLFPKENIMPLKTSFFGWNYIWFYLNHDNLDDSLPNPSGDHTMFTHPKVKTFAEDYFDFCLNEKNYSKRNFEKKVLELFQKNQITPRIMQEWFCELASKYKGYTSEEWDDLCKDENGYDAIYEVRFQLRLHFINLYREFNWKSTIKN